MAKFYAIESKKLTIFLILKLASLHPTCNIQISIDVAITRQAFFEIIPLIWCNSVTVKTQNQQF